MTSTLDMAVVAIRALAFIAVLQAAGAVLFLVLFRERLVESMDTIRAIGARAAAAGVFLIVARYLLEPARMAGSFSGIFDSFLHGILLTSNLGVTQLTRVVGAGIVALTLLGPPRPREYLALIGAALIVVSFSFMGHTAANDQRWILSTLLILHLLVVAFWFGGLMPLHVACSRETLADASNLIARFSSVAVRTVPLILLAGIGMALVLLPRLSSLGSAYGTLLIVKVAGFTVLMVFAALNKYRFGPAVAAGNQRAVHFLQRSVALEAALIVLILATTAVMTTLYSPE